MVWQTYYKCECVEIARSKGSNNTLMAVDVWQPAKVYLSETSGEKRWILVTVDGETTTPVVWHAISDGWIVMCDEETLTTAMQSVSGNDGTLSITTDKFRFSTPKDFWSFLAHYSFGRVHAYSGQWAGTTASQMIAAANAGGQ